MAVSGERDGHLSSDVGREPPPNRAALTERMRDYALATLICVSSSRFRVSFVLPFWFGR